MEKHLEPSESQRAKLMSLPADTPLAVLNLFEFHERANYQPEDPEYGTDAAEISGQDAYRLYSDIAGELIQALGGRIAFSTAAEQVLIGPDYADWDVAAIMYFPSRGAFMQMMMDPGFQETSRHRKAALKHHYMIHLKGDAFET
ncbi:MAG: DUF1330 domain-containing protein [Pseudomonadota bacterium]